MYNFSRLPPSIPYKHEIDLPPTSIFWIYSRIYSLKIFDGQDVITQSSGLKVPISSCLLKFKEWTKNYLITTRAEGVYLVPLEEELALWEELLDMNFEQQKMEDRDWICISTWWVNPNFDHTSDVGRPRNCWVEERGWCRFHELVIVNSYITRTMWYDH